MSILQIYEENTNNRTVSDILIKVNAYKRYDYFSKLH